ncbi:MAG: ADP-ribose pyrophosphatase, partial [Sphingobacteriales bacterium]
MSEKNPWKTNSSKKVYENPWIKVEEHQVINPNGGEGIYGVVDFKNLAIGIVPIDDEGMTWLVGQYRYPLDAYSWEIPEGGGEKDVDPTESAKRELKEECGIEAKSWRLIQEMDLSNSVSNEKAFIYLATNLSFGKSNPDETEKLVIKKIHLNDAFEM